MKANTSLTGRYFASNLKRLRAQEKLTCKQVGDYVGVSPQTVSRYEQYGTTNSFPNDVEIIDRLASLFKVRIADFFRPEGATEKQMYLSPSEEDAIYIVSRKLQEGKLKIALVPTTPNAKDDGLPVPPAH